MFMYTVEYVDFNGNNRSDDLYFHMNKPELIRFQYSVPGGLDKKMENIKDKMNNEDPEAVVGLFDFFDLLISKSYGVKTDDGKKFIKSQEILDDFMSSEAYAVFFDKFMSDPDFMLKFVEGVMPSEVMKSINESSEYLEMKKRVKSEMTVGE